LNPIQPNPTNVPSLPPNKRLVIFCLPQKKGKIWIFGQFFHSVNSANFAIHFGRIHQIFNMTKLGKKNPDKAPNQNQDKIKKNLKLREVKPRIEGETKV